MFRSQRAKRHLVTVAYVLHYAHPVDNSLPEASPANAAELAAWLRDLQKRAKLSTRKLASMVEADRSQVYKWLGLGSAKPQEPQGVNLLRLLAVLGVQMNPPPPDALLGDSALLRQALDVIERQMKLLERVAAELGVEEEPPAVRRQPRRRQTSH